MSVQQPPYLPERGGISSDTNIKPTYKEALAEIERLRAVIADVSIDLWRERQRRRVAEGKLKEIER